tara:strand:+ start:808 stop:1578 length:771 start_codon:yes stop_codon:yes gene_type:complete
MPEGDKVVRITVIETGGEFTGGTITDKDTIEVIKQKIEDGEMSSMFDFAEGDNFDACSFNDLFGIYGPHVPGSKVRIEESNNGEDGDFEETYEGPIADTDIRTFTSSNPYPEKITEDKLRVYTYKYEKRIHSEFTLTIPKGEELDLKDIYLGGMNMDETIFTDDEILEHILYIPKKDLDPYLVEYQEDELDEGEDRQELMEDLIPEIFSDCPELAKKITDKHTIYEDNCEGKGEWENDYVKIVDSSDEILFEGGAY